MSAPLRPCPFCGSTAVRLRLTTHEVFSAVYSAQVECWSCELAAPAQAGYKSREEARERAIEYWNHRSES